MRIPGLGTIKPHPKSLYARVQSDKPCEEFAEDIASELTTEAGTHYLTESYYFSLRELFQCSDGGTIALDWLSNSDEGIYLMNSFISKDDTTPIAVVVPGLTSDSASVYLKHFAFDMAKKGWHVVISNHRGLGGVSITSNCFYNAGWTEDVRAVVKHLHSEYPKAPLFVVGTSIGANVLVKYLGEDGDDVPVAGAVAICSPWDLLIGDRFISRRLVQKLYDRALAIGLQGYAQLYMLLFHRV